MDIVSSLLDFILHVDRHLMAFVADHGAWVYLLLFAIVFAETGLVFMPFLPGDSLLFVVGAMTGSGILDFSTACGLLLAAAILGDQLNYTLGRLIGPKVFQWENSRLFNKQAFEQAHLFYERRGGITIVLARFMPLVRTFVPFVAGVSQMSRNRFTAYNVLGGVIWVVGLLTLGYWFGNQPWVQQNLSKIIWGLILIPSGLALMAMRRRGDQSSSTRRAG